MPIGAMNLIAFRVELMGEIEYEQEAQILESLSLDWPDTRPKIMEL